MADKPIAVDTPKKTKATKTSKPDIATILGLLIAVAGILGGLVFEGGKVRDVMQPTAAAIVLGGTIGAVMVNTPGSVLMGGMRRLVQVFIEKNNSPALISEEIIAYATKARKNGIVSLEQEANAVQDPFLRKALNLAVDGSDLNEIRKMLELEITLTEERAIAEAKVFESAGGYSPTIGIIGAVLGLIQVMKHLENIEEVGKGIAVAFVATIYGVAVSNILFLPAANKIKARAKSDSMMRELIVEGVAAIVEGLNPKLIRSKLEAYAPPALAKKVKPGKPEKAEKPAAATASAQA